MRFTPLQSTGVRLRETWPAQAPAWRTLAVPDRLRVPLATRPVHDASPFVAAGTDVVRGQRLTDPSLRTIPAALAPADGRVVAAGPIALLNGQIVPAAELEIRTSAAAVSPESDAPAPAGDATALPRLGPADRAGWLDRILDAGIAADRLSSPDLLAQLHQALRRPIDTVICNLLDSDPDLRLNAVLAATFADELAAGTALLARLTSASAWIVAEAGTPYVWVRRLRALIRPLSLRLLWPRNDYPQSDPTLLLYTLLGRRLRPRRLPTEQGVILLDAATAVALGRLVLLGQPTLQCPLAVRDHSQRRSHYLLTWPGVSVRQALGELGIPADATVVRAGDMLRDVRIGADTVIGGGGELVLHVTPPELPDSPEACIRCGWCAEGCPTHVQPAGLLDAAQRNDTPMAEHYGIEACIECGICAYVCPAHLPLLRGIRSLRQYGGGASDTDRNRRDG